MKIKNIYQRVNDHKADRRTLNVGYGLEFAVTIYKDPVPPTHVINLAQALATPWTGSPVYSGEEKFFYSNFLNYYRLSNRLYQQNEFREALLSLHLSTEMLMKHLLAKTTHFYRQASSNVPAEFIDVMFKVHDISVISKPLMLAISNIRTNSFQDIQFEGNQMKNQLGKWQKMRYSNPVDFNRNIRCKNIYLSLRPKLKVFYKYVASHGTVKWI